MPSCLATASAVRRLSPDMRTTCLCRTRRISQTASRASRFGESSTAISAIGTNAEGAFAVFAVFAGAIAQSTAVRARSSSARITRSTDEGIRTPCCSNQLRFPAQFIPLEIHMIN